MSTWTATRVDMSLVVLAGPSPESAGAVASALAAAGPRDEVVVVSTGLHADAHAVLRRHAGRVRSVVLPAGAPLDEDAVVRAARAVACGERVVLAGAPRAAAPTAAAPPTGAPERRPCAVTFVVDCTGDPSAAVRTAVAVVTAAAQREDWEAELVLSGDDPALLAELALAFGGDVRTHSGPGAPEAHGLVVAHLVAGDAFDGASVAEVDAALADATGRLRADPAGADPAVEEAEGVGRDQSRSQLARALRVVLVEQAGTGVAQAVVSELQARADLVARFTPEVAPSSGPAFGDERASLDLSRLVRHHAADVVVLAGLGGWQHLHAHLVEAARESGAVTALVLHDEELLDAAGVPAVPAPLDATTTELRRRSTAHVISGADVVVLAPGETALPSAWAARVAVVRAQGPEWWEPVERAVAQPLAPLPDRAGAGPQIAVVIATHDRREPLRRALEGFCRQTLPADRFEVVVVDDASAETVDDVVDSFRGRLDVSLVRRDRNGGVGPARATGVAAVRSPLTVFFDDDNLPGPRLLEEHLRRHAEHPAVTDVVLGSMGAGDGLMTSNVTYAVTQTAHSYVYFQDLTDGQQLDWHYAWGGCSSYKTALMREHPYTMAWMEDTEHAWRLRTAGLRVFYARHAAQVFDDAFTVDRYSRRCRRHGAAAVEVADLHADPELTAVLRVDGLAVRARDAARGALGARRVVDRFDAVPRSQLRATAVGTEDGRTVSAAELLDRAYELLFESERLAGAVTQRVGPALAAVAASTSTTS